MFMYANSPSDVDACKFSFWCLCMQILLLMFMRGNSPSNKLKNDKKEKKNINEENKMNFETSKKYFYDVSKNVS